jgi:hypothetical protein
MIPIEPVERLGEPAARHVHAVEPPVARAHDQARMLQHAHVPRDGGCRHPEGLGELADRGGTRGQPLQHVPPGGVGERREHGIERIGLTVNHVVNYKHRARRAQGGTSGGRLPSQWRTVEAVARLHPG